MKRWFAIFVIAFFAVAMVTHLHWKRARTVIHPPNNDPWKLVSYDPDNPYGTYLGNGFIATRVMGDGVGTKCYMAGLYDNEKLIPTPNWADLRLYDGKKQFKIDKDAPYKQVLDMKAGILTTYATWRAGDKTLKGMIEVIVSRARPNVGLLRTEIRPDFDGDLCAYSGTDVPEAIHVLSASEEEDLAEMKMDAEYSVFRVKGSGQHLGIASYLTYDPMITPPAYGGGSAPNGVESTFVIAVKKRTPLRISRHVAVVVAPTADAARSSSLTQLEAAIRQGETSIIRDHNAAWAKLWKHDIIIDGPKKDQQAIHSCMFYLLQSVREGSQWSIPPMGLSNDSFSGHVFWDADLWMFPALILQHPELARSIVDYRYNTLPGAMANAKASGYAGAEYAWESGYTGKEDTPPGLNYRHERHINGAIAIAQWQYYLATGNNEWLKTRGFPVLKATADYWVSRVTYNKAQDRYEIHKVCPPDENAEMVNNSVYTNAIAQMNLQLAHSAAVLLGSPDARWSEVRKDGQIVGVVSKSKWSEVAAKMYIPFDAKARRFIPFDGYKGFPAKQADTELLAYPLQFKLPKGDMTEIYKNTFRFYQPRVQPNGPAMSASAHTVIASRLGDCDGAYKFWRESYTPFLRGPFNYFNEKRSKTWEQMCFLTGAAGPIQSALFGLAGVRMDYHDVTKNGLSFSPCLPKQWKSLKVTGITWRGKQFDLLVEHGKSPVIQNSKPITHN